MFLNRRLEVFLRSWLATLGHTEIKSKIFKSLTFVCAMENLTGENEEKCKSLSEAQIKRIERNKQKAVQLRKTRVANIQKANETVCQIEVDTFSRSIDTGGGFLLDDNDTSSQSNTERPIVNIPAPLFSGDRPTCLECHQTYSESYLYHHFDYSVCDSCRDADGKHCLISRTDAKKEYLLKDCDFDKREPQLKFILKKNPYNVHGNMKLYLRLQVEKRAFEIFGSEDELEEAKDLKAEAQVKRKQKAFDKKVKALRMSVRSSLYRRKDSGHEHSYGPESYNEADDSYEKTCATCGNKLHYEKM